MNYARLTVDVGSLHLNHQHFFYLDRENDLKTTMEAWPTLQPLYDFEELSSKANVLLLIMQSLVKEAKMIHISRERVSKKSRRIAKRAANLNKLLYFLYDKGYLSFQFDGVSGRKQFITLNPQIFIQ